MAKIEFDSAKIVGQIQAQPFFAIAKLLLVSKVVWWKWKKLELQFGFLHFGPSTSNSWHWELFGNGLKKNPSCNSFFGFLGHYQTTFGTERCLVMVKKFELLFRFKISTPITEIMWFFFTKLNNFQSQELFNDGRINLNNNSSLYFSCKTKWLLMQRVV